MQLRLPILHAQASVPAWCVAVAALWPVMFFSFLLHSFTIGGDAINGKAEAGRYFLRKTFRSEGDRTPYVEVSKIRYTANYTHAVATMIFAIPAFVGIWRIVRSVAKQIPRDSDATQAKR